MKEQDSNLKYSKKGKRSISEFVSQELLYDYVINKLDRERAQAVEAQLEKSKELKGELDKIRGGLRYSRTLNSIQVPDEVAQKIQLPSSSLEHLLTKARFEKWPQGLKWGLESLAVAILITLVAMMVPWERALKLNFGQKSTYVIAELKNDHQNKTEEAVSGGAPLYPDENKPVESKSAASEATSKPETKEATSLANSAPNPIANQPPAPNATKPIESQPSPLAGTKIKTIEATKKEVGGFLYRGILHASNVPVITPKLVDEIGKLGGRKAGEVDLGWKKGSGSYFHFTMPQSKYEELNKILSTYGKLKLQKENHERVMPDGIIRLIILVEEAGKK